MSRSARVDDELRSRPDAGVVRAFQALLEAAPDAMVIVDADGAIALANGQAERLFGYGPGDLIGCTVEVLVPDRYSAHSRYRGGFLAAPRFRPMGAGLELSGRRRDGSEVPVEISLSPLETADGVFAVAAIRDVSERMRVERELRDANAELDAFAYSVAHDLRVPLHTIAGFSEIVLAEHGIGLPEEGKRYLRRVIEGAHEMDCLISDLLSLSQAARAELQCAEIDLSGIARDILAGLSRAEPERPVTLAVAGGLMGSGDCDLVRVALTNLLGNAWKFTAATAGAHIEFGACSDQRCLFVRDNGVGFDMSQAERLFHPFQRLHATCDFPGTGIGLAIADRIIRRHGGRIWAQSEVNCGATFFFTLGTAEPGPAFSEEPDASLSTAR